MKIRATGKSAIYEAIEATWNRPDDSRITSMMAPEPFEAGCDCDYEPLDADSACCGRSEGGENSPSEFAIGPGGQGALLSVAPSTPTIHGMSRDPDLLLRFNEFWPRNMASPTAFPWLGAMVTRAGAWYWVSGLPHRASQLDPADPRGIAEFIAASILAEDEDIEDYKRSCCKGGGETPRPPLPPGPDEEGWRICDNEGGSQQCSDGSWVDCFVDPYCNLRCNACPGGTETTTGSGEGPDPRPGPRR